MIDADVNLSPRRGVAVAPGPEFLGGLAQAAGVGLAAIATAASTGLAGGLLAGQRVLLLPAALTPCPSPGRRGEPGALAPCTSLTRRGKQVALTPCASLTRRREQVALTPCPSLTRRREPARRRIGAGHELPHLLRPQALDVAGEGLDLADHGRPRQELVEVDRRHPPARHGVDPPAGAARGLTSGKHALTIGLQKPVDANAVQAGRQTELGRLRAADRPDRTQDRVEVGQQPVQAGGVNAWTAKFEPGAQAADQFHLRGQHLARQDCGGELLEQAPPGRLAHVEQRAGVAPQQEVPGGGQARRPATHDRHAPTAGFRLVGQVRDCRGQVLIRHAAFDRADGHRGIEGLATARPFTGAMTYAAQGRRQGQVLLGNGDGLGKTARADLPQHGRDVCMRRATLGAEGGAVAHVVAEQQFHRGAAHLLDLEGLRLDLHAVGDLHRARRDHLARPRQLHRADQA